MKESIILNSLQRIQKPAWASIPGQHSPSAEGQLVSQDYGVYIVLHSLTLQEVYLHTSDLGGELLMKPRKEA